LKTGSIRGNRVEKPNSHSIPIFDLHPHSPGNDGNGSNVKSSSASGRDAMQVHAARLESCAAGNDRRKTSQVKNGWLVLKGQSAYPPRFGGTGREKQTSFGKVWAD